MNSDLEHLLGWALTAINLSVTAVVAWALALLLAASSLHTQVAHVEPPNQVVAIISGLDFVSMPTVYLPGEAPPVISGSAAVAPRNAETFRRPH